MRVSGRTPSKLGVELKADASTFEYERHRACLRVKNSTDEPSHVPLHTRPLRGAALFQACPRKPRKGVSGDGGSQLVLTLYHIISYCFQMCNRLPELIKNGDAGIFPVYYSLNAWKNPDNIPTTSRLYRVVRRGKDYHSYFWATPCFITSVHTQERRRTNHKKERKRHRTK